MICVAQAHVERYNLTKRPKGGQRMRETVTSQSFKLRKADSCQSPCLLALVEKFHVNGISFGPFVGLARYFLTVKYHVMIGWVVGVFG